MVVVLEEGAGFDQEKVGAACDFCCDAVREAKGLVAGAFQSSIMSGVAVAAFLPLTRLSKSTSSPFAVVVASPLVLFCVRVALVAVVLLPDDSPCSFRVCSRSILAVRLLIRAMNA